MLGLALVLMDYLRKRAWRAHWYEMKNKSREHNRGGKVNERSGLIERWILFQAVYVTNDPAQPPAEDDDLEAAAAASAKEAAELNFDADMLVLELAKAVNDY
jgi:hypothetical protein